MSQSSSHVFRLELIWLLSHLCVPYMLVCLRARASPAFEPLLFPYQVLMSSDLNLWLLSLYAHTVSGPAFGLEVLLAFEPPSHLSTLMPSG